MRITPSLDRSIAFPSARVTRTANGSDSVTEAIWPNGMRSTAPAVGASTSAPSATLTSAEPSSRWSPAGERMR
ncbi:MAG: hypothetical protein ACRDPY_28680 [Streptosporangiaceae bacterium]